MSQPALCRHARQCKAGCMLEMNRNTILGLLVMCLWDCRPHHCSRHVCSQRLEDFCGPCIAGGHLWVCSGNLPWSGTGPDSLEEHGLSSCSLMTSNVVRIGACLEECLFQAWVKTRRDDLTAFAFLAACFLPGLTFGRQRFFWPQFSPLCQGLWRV